MFKGVTSLGGVPTLILGLSGENAARLMADEPMLVDTTDPGLRGSQVELPVMRVLVVGGRTEQAILADVQSAVGPVSRVYPELPQVHAGSHELLLRMLHGEVSRWRSTPLGGVQKVALETAADALEKVAAQIAELLENPPGVGVTLTALSQGFREAAGIIAMGAAQEAGRG